MTQASSPIIDLLLSQKFLPEHGGSILWMYQLYRRWPGQVQVLTHDYYDHPPLTPEMPDAVIPRPPEGDHVTDANLQMDRRDIFIRDWGLESVSRLLRYWRMTRAIAQRLSQHPQARLRVHCTHAVPEVVALLPLLCQRRYRRRMRVICYAHGEEITACQSSRQLHAMLRAAYKRCDLVICNSRFTVDRAGRYVPQDRLHVMHPGVDLSEYDGADQAGRQWRHAAGLNDKLVVLCVGRMDPRKNHAALVRAMVQLKDDVPTAHLVLVGEGRERGGLEQIVAAGGITDRVTFAGAVDGQTKRAMFGGCDVFAMPAVRAGTDVEGFGIVFIEAGACGKPVLAGCEGGQVDAVVDGQTGLIVDGTQQDQVTRALRTLLTDASLRAKMGQAGRAHARQLDWSVLVQRACELVEDDTRQCLPH